MRDKRRLGTTQKETEREREREREREGEGRRKRKKKCKREREGIEKHEKRREANKHPRSTREQVCGVHGTQERAG